MTLKELAQIHGLSRQTAYNKIKAAGIDLKAFRDAEGNLTQGGIQTLNTLFEAAVQEASQKTSKRQEVCVNENTRNEQIHELRQQLVQAQETAKEQQARADRAEALLSAAHEERDFLRAQLDSALKSVALLSVPRLEAKPGIIHRLKAVFSSDAGK